MILKITFEYLWVLFMQSKEKDHAENLLDLVNFCFVNENRRDFPDSSGIPCKRPIARRLLLIVPKSARHAHLLLFSFHEISYILTPILEHIVFNSF